MRDPALDAWGGYDRDNPFPLFARVRAAGPVHEATLPDGQRAWLVVRHAEARAALNDPRLSKDMHAALARDGAVVAEGLPGPAFARHMLSVDPPDHTRLRGLATAAFTRSRIAALRPRVQAIVDDLLDTLHSRGDTAVDLVAGFAFPLPFTVISELLGIPEPDRAELGAWFTTLLAPASAPEPPASAVAASANIVDYLTELLDRKRAEPGQDLVTDLVRAADERNTLNQQEMLSTIFQLTVAGHDTTTSLIGNGTVALLRHPDQRAALAADPALLPRAIEEMLRWDAPVPHSTFRYTTQDVPLGDVVIPAHAQVIISLAAANRDPDRYQDAESFEPVRSGAGGRDQARGEMRRLTRLSVRSARRPSPHAPVDTRRRPRPHRSALSHQPFDGAETQVLGRRGNPAVGFDRGNRNRPEYDSGSPGSQAGEGAHIGRGRGEDSAEHGQGDSDRRQQGPGAGGSPRG
jgi:cytochrome P450